MATGTIDINEARVEVAFERACDKFFPTLHKENVIYSLFRQMAATEFEKLKLRDEEAYRKTASDNALLDEHFDSVGQNLLQHIGTAIDIGERKLPFKLPEGIPVVLRGTAQISADEPKPWDSRTINEYNIKKGYRLAIMNAFVSVAIEVTGWKQWAEEGELYASFINHARQAWHDKMAGNKDAFMEAFYEETSTGDMRPKDDDSLRRFFEKEADVWWSDSSVLRAKVYAAESDLEN